MGKSKKLKEQRKIERTLEQENKKNRKKKLNTILTICFVGLVVIIVIVLSFSKKDNNLIDDNIINENNMIKVTMQTEKGDIELELNKEAAPKTVDNFVKLSNDGFYNGLTFHRVIQEFMIQGGDPSGNGSGGPGYAFEDEINPMSIGVNEQTIKELESEGYVYDYSLKSMSHEVGAISMANAGPNTNGSQFFIITQQPQPHLNGMHTVFGEVVNGMDIVRKIEQNDIINKVIINQ